MLFFEIILLLFFAGNRNIPRQLQLNWFSKCYIQNAFFQAVPSPVFHHIFGHEFLTFFGGGGMNKTNKYFTFVTGRGAVAWNTGRSAQKMPFKTGRPLMNNYNLNCLVFN